MTLSHQNNNGFTLIESIVVICIIAIIITIAYPSMISQLANMEAKRIRQTFRNTIKIARATSYIHHKHVFMCLSNTTDNCHKDANHKILLFFDNNKNNHYDALSDTLIFTEELDLSYSEVHIRAAKRHYVRFSGDTGLPRGHFGHFKYCPTHIYNQNMYQLSFNQVGGTRYKPNSIHPTGC